MIDLEKAKKAKDCVQVQPPNKIKLPPLQLGSANTEAYNFDYDRVYKLDSKEESRRLFAELVHSNLCWLTWQALEMLLVLLLCACTHVPQPFGAPAQGVLQQASATGSGMVVSAPAASSADRWRNSWWEGLCSNTGNWMQLTLRACCPAMTCSVVPGSRIGTATHKQRGACLHRCLHMGRQGLARHIQWAQQPL